MPLSADHTPTGPRCPVCAHPLARRVHADGTAYTHRPGAPACTTTGADTLALLAAGAAARGAGWRTTVHVPGADLVLHRTGSPSWYLTRPGHTSPDTDPDRTVLLVGPHRPAPVDAATLHLDTRRTTAAGVGKPVQSWCADRTDCMRPDTDIVHLSPLACTGHPGWERVRLHISAFVSAALAGRIVLAPTDARARSDGPTVWTTPAHANTAAQHASWARQVRADADVRAARYTALGFWTIQAHRARRAELGPAAVAWGLSALDASVTVQASEGETAWANGAPVRDASGAVVAVLCPVAHRVAGPVREALAATVVLAGSAMEADRLARVCAPGQRVVNLHQLRPGATRHTASSGANE